MKAQLLISLESKTIYGISSGKGKTHDFKMFKDSKIHIPSNIKLLADSGYQGIKDLHNGYSLLLMCKS
jgi:histidine ammonia-lyase